MFTRVLDVYLVQGNDLLPDETRPVTTPRHKISSAVNEVGAIPNDHIHNDVAGAVQLSSEIGSVVSALCNLQ